MRGFLPRGAKGSAMAGLFANPLHDRFGMMPLGYAPYGGIGFGEVQAVAEAVGQGDDGAFCSAWVSAGDRLAGESDAAHARGHIASARSLLLKAACCYATAYRPLFGFPVDPRLLAAFRKQMAAFDKALALGDGSARRVDIPFEGTTLPGYFVGAVGHADAVRPLLICTNGYDATVTDMYFASAVAAAERGYHCLIFDGPGQGESLYERGLHLRPDWESVVKAVVDVALTIPGVDPARIALNGWSLGGYLAPRAASGERRLAGCIADPGLWGIASGLGAFLARFDNSLEKFAAAIASDPTLHWTFVQRGYWVHGVDSLEGYLQAITPFTIDGRAEEIRCQTLLTRAEGDPLAAGAQQFFDALRCPKTLLTFTAAEGGGQHCEMFNRPLLNARVFDWLDENLGGLRNRTLP